MSKTVLVSLLVFISLVSVALTYQVTAPNNGVGWEDKGALLSKADVPSVDYNKKLQDEKVSVVVAWGDSLTAGAGASGPNTNYPAALSLDLGLLRAQNNGVGGESSSQILKRVLAASPPGAHEVTLIWAGRNDYQTPETVLSNIDQMVQRLGDRRSRWLVGSIINGLGEERGTDRYAKIVALNQALEQKYTDRFVDLRAALIAASSQSDGDVPGANLRFDFIHLNDAGYRVVADAWARAIRQHGWAAE